MSILGFRVRVWGFQVSILGFRVKGFETPISNFGLGFSEPDFKFRKGFSEPDFQNFDAQMPKFIPKSYFFVKISFKIQFFFTRNSKISHKVSAKRARCGEILRRHLEDHQRFFRSELKKNLANKIFGYLARCEFWLKIRW